LCIPTKNIARIKWKTKTYHTVGTIPYSNIKIVEKGKIDITKDLKI
jgi:hypothetical protein